MKRAARRAELKVKPKQKTANEGPTLGKLPNWYRPGPFLYDARIVMFSFTCLLVVVLLAGELLLTVLAVGSLVIHVINSVGAKRQAVAGYLCVFIITELAVIYSAVPLLWISFYNVLLLFALNSFVVFTGGWVLLHFDAFLQEEPSLAVFIETSLFTFYPGLCIIIMSWIVVQAVSVSAVPYCLILFGFISAQLFLPQQPSSFHKSESRQSAHSVLNPVEVATVLTIYNLLPMQSFIFINFWNILELTVFLKMIFVMTCPLFLTTLIDIHYVFEHFGVSLKQKTKVRWLTGIICLSIIHIVAYLDKLVSSGLLPWLPAVFVLNLPLGIFMNWRTPGRKIAILLLACACFVLYVAMISFIVPLNLETDGVSSKVIWLLLVCNAGLSVACVVMAAISTKEHFSDLLLCSVAVFVFSEHQLLSLGLYSLNMFVITIPLGWYMLSKLQHAGKVSWYVTWLSIGMHSTKLPVFLENQLRLDHHFGSSPFLDKIFIALFILSVSKLFFFESRRSVPIHHAVGYAFSITILSLLVMDSLLQPIFIMVSHSDINTAGSLALVLITSGALLLKLTLSHMTKFQDARTLNLISILLGFFIFILQPSSETSFSNMCNILLLVSFIACLVLFLTRSPRSRPLCLDIVYSIVIGSPIAIKACQLLMIPEHIRVLNITLYMLAWSLTTFILISTTLWIPSSKYNKSSTAFLPSATVSISIIFVIIYILEFKQIGNAYIYTIGSFYGKYSQPCTKLFLIIFLSIAINLKSLLGKIAADDPFGAIYPTSLPVVINMATFLSYALLLINYPPDILPELWACVSSMVFLLITKDHLLFSKISKFKKPGIVFTTCVIVLYIATLYENSIWWQGLGFWCIFELMICVIVSPVFFSVSCFVLNRFYVMPIQRVVFLSPICVFLPLFGTTPASWILGILGLVAGLGSSYYAAPTSDVDNFNL
ncbi:uncharacterized protein LOC117118745 isoform X1 [Anneissia japonica]|uniref:uncharacterized protein LOC117118745 isoform X1 n=1 Tax=Anneissia japonica TaxID=1529436 RepID=UPI0014255C71|nr:uncharacterized protein LOC117118745 isoform X1 [Anneissia japonica]